MHEPITRAHSDIPPATFAEGQPGYRSLAAEWNLPDSRSLQRRCANFFYLYIFRAGGHKPAGGEFIQPSRGQQFV